MGCNLNELILIVTPSLPQASFFLASLLVPTRWTVSAIRWGTFHWFRRMRIVRPGFYGSPGRLRVRDVTVAAECPFRQPISSASQLVVK